MKYIKFEGDFILDAGHNNSVFTEDLPLKWLCSYSLFPDSEHILKFVLINSDPGIDRRSSFTTVEFFREQVGQSMICPGKRTFTFVDYNSETAVEVSNHMLYTIGLRFTVHVPKISDIAGYDFTEKNAENEMILTVEGKKFHINKAVLSAYSPFFNNLFNNANFDEYKKDEIELKDLDPEEFEVLLQVTYPSNFTVNGDNVEFLWKLADRFAIVSVAKICENFLCDMEGKQNGKFSIENRMRIANLYNSEKLKTVLYKQMEDLNM